MKKFICGFLIGAMLFGTIGAFAVSYVANPVDFKVLVNGEEFVSDPPALEVEGRTYLPLRAMGEALGVPVTWNEELRQAEVGTAPSDSTVSSTVQTSDKWKMTYLNCKEYSQINEYTKAEEGKKYVVVTFEVENISAESQTFSYFYLSSYFDDYKTPITILGQQVDGATMLTASTIEAGKKIKGYFCYQVEPNWSKIDIVYQDDIFNEKEPMKFTINR